MSNNKPDMFVRNPVKGPARALLARNQWLQKINSGISDQWRWNGIPSQNSARQRDGRELWSVKFVTFPAQSPLGEIPLQQN